MRSARVSTFRRRRRSSTKDLDDELQDLSVSSSRPSTQDSKRSSYSRLSTDSGEGSLEDFSRRNSSPVFWGDGTSRRHTAPIRKSFSPTDEDQAARPNTVHAWDSCSPRCSLSRYAPLPGIGQQQQTLGQYDGQQQHLNLIELDRPVPVRRQCFMGPLDIDIEEFTHVDDNDNRLILERTDSKPVFSLTLDSDTDSDFEEESESLTHGESESDVSEIRPRRPIIRSATFTIEKERPEIHGPFLSIAVRLPNGTRVAKKFDSKETLQNVCEFAIETIEGSHCSKWCLATTDVPKRTFKNLSMSLKEADIDDKTLMCLQPLDDSDSD